MKSEAQRKVTVFLSHSTADKAIVEQVAQFLSSYGVTVWIDSKSIRAGVGITRRLEEGVAECDFLLLFLTPKSVASGWVNKEWQTKLTLHINEDSTRIIPLLIEDCDVPVFLRDVKYIDFRKSMETGKSALLAALHVSNDVIAPRNTVSEYTADFLDDLKDEFISLPSIRRIEIINLLKRLPRSGKKIRLEAYSRPKIPIRSVYDHILSVAHSADCLLSVVNHKLSDHDASEIARCIAYHELNEVVLGDIPVYTNLSRTKRASARVYAEERLRRTDGKERERIANEFVGMFLNSKQRECMRIVTNLSQAGTSPVYRFFRLIDKIDPIVTVWRYLHVYRGKFEDGPQDFLKRLRDFFENQEVKTVAGDYKEDNRVYDMVVTLQDRDKAARYYQDREAIRGQPSLFGFKNETVLNLIEGRALTFAESGPI